MTSPSANLQRCFLSWEKPLLAQAVAALAAGWTGGAPLDLSDQMVLVPTRQAGRRLREALAAHAADRGRAVFPPRVLTLDAIAAEEPAPDEATRLDALLAWAHVFLEADLDEFRAVFPLNPPERNFAWALGLAGEFARLQETLAEIGLHLADVPHRVEPTFPELDRWRDIAELGRLQTQALAAQGLGDAITARLRRLATATVPPGIARVILLATPDPRPVALTALARLAAQVPVEVWVYASPDEATAFDEWGRPRPEQWEHRPLLTENFAEQITLCADPEEQAERAAGLARDYADSEGVLGVGIVDPEIISPLERALSEADLIGYNPEGKSRRGDRLHQLLQAFGALARDDSFAAVATLARQPDVLRALRQRLGEGFSAARFLQLIDRVHAHHLPADLAAARRHWRGGDELKIIAGWRDRLRRGTFPENVCGVLAELFAERRFNPADADEAALAEAAEAWAEVTCEVARTSERFSELGSAETWELALRLYGERANFPHKPAGAVELQGWLELVWEDAPHLVVAGFNDGLVPDAVSGDVFLPEGLRVRLGLKTNAMRFATDAYYLQALAVSRAHDGRLDLLLGRTSAVGDPLRPSRLLLRCADDELPRRVEILFRDLPARGANLAWTRAWQLQPPCVEVEPRLAVTALRAWLDCPFRFYLSRGLHMESVDPAKVELDAMDFGTLCHAALEAMGREEALRDCTDAAQLKAFLLQQLDAATERIYGHGLSLPLIVQRESARQRLAFAAEVQAQSCAEGWVIERVEWKFEYAVGNLMLAGKIDRIDRHESTGAVRVLDYKTSDTAVNPAEAHLRGLRADEEPADWRLVELGGKARTWKDLQLPVYERVALREFPEAAISCGYFNLPKAASETAIVLWADYDRELAAAAWRCAEGVAAAIERREFWPPREVSGWEEEWDDFASLFQRGAAASVDPAVMLATKGGEA